MRHLKLYLGRIGNGGEDLTWISKTTCVDNYNLHTDIKGTDNLQEPTAGSSRLSVTSPPTTRLSSRKAKKKGLKRVRGSKLSSKR